MKLFRFIFIPDYHIRNGEFYHFIDNSWHYIIRTIGAVTAVMNIPNAEAKSCNQFDFGFDCVEGSIFSQGAIGSDGQCHHHR